MKRTHFRNLFLTSVSILSLSVPAFAVNPTSVKITLYKIGVSASADCSSPTWVASSTDGVEVDFMTGATLGSPFVEDGTYPCIMLQMSDIIKFKSSATTGSCTADTEYTIDVCRSGSGTFTALSSDGTFASSASCTGSDSNPANDRPVLFLSTASTNTGGGGSAFDKPANATSTTNGFTLNGALTVSGSGSGTFVVNFDDKIDGSNASCDVQPPVFGFR